MTTSASASSVALLKVLWELCWGLPPACFEPSEPGTGLSGRRPFLEIGNLALRLHMDPPAGWHIVDLAAAWRDWTGLPFVFAVWIVRRGLSPSGQELLEDVHAALLRCKATCVQAIAEIADFRDLSAWITRRGIEDYLATVGYDLGPSEQASLALFGSLCTRLGLIPGMPSLAWATA
jgi:chorismate dehydratase